MASEGPRTLEVVIRAPVARSDPPALYSRVCALLSRETGASSLVCDVAGAAADAVCVDALARLELAARRHGCSVRLRGASRELRSLIALMGLEDVLAG